MSSMNGDVSSLKTLVNALDGRDYVTGVEALEDGSGYKILFAVAPAITVKHGTDGADGDSAPVIGIKADEDGVYYWTLTSDGEPEWLLDADGNKMPVSGRDGESGFAPKIGVDDEGFWTVDHGNGPERVLDTAGDPISALGSKGSSFFTDVTHTASTITFTFEDGTSITLKKQTTPAAVTLSITDADAGVNVFLLGQSESRTFTLSQANVSSLTIIKPDGWQATVSGNTLTVTAPAYANAYSADNGTVTLLGVSSSGQAASASMQVEFGIPYAGNDFLTLLVTDPSRTNTQGDTWGERVYLDPDEGSGRRGYFTRSDAARVKYIHVGNKGLLSLSGLAYFPALEFLYCAENSSLTGTLDVSGLKNLQTLYCYSTGFSTLDVSGCVNLQELYCHFTNLFTLDVSGCVNLQELYCHFTNLSGTLNVSGCVNLETLECRNIHNLSMLDVSGCENLSKLECYATNLSTLDVSDCVNLENLECFSTNLDALDVLGLTNLRKLDCSGTNLGKLDVSGLTNLWKLDCSRISDLSTLDVSTCTGLEYLWCGSFDENEADPKLIVTVAGGTDLVTSGGEVAGKLYVQVRYNRISGVYLKDYGDTLAIGMVVSGVKVVKAP